MVMFLVLQALYSLSDQAAELQIKDRLSFPSSLRLGLDGTISDPTTVSLFCERLVEAKLIDKLCARFDEVLTDRGYLAMGGQIIDAMVVQALLPSQASMRLQRRTRYLQVWESLA